MDGLKSCPFCGNNNIEFVYPNELHILERAVALRCGECGSMGPLETTKHNAQYKWNKRYRKRKGINVSL